MIYVGDSVFVERFIKEDKCLQVGNEWRKEARL